MIANASSRALALPKNAGAEPMPPKLPQPRMMRDTRMPVCAQVGSLHVHDATRRPGARRRFSSLQGDFVFLDAPGGSQVPDEVGDAIARTLREASANIGANYETSKRVERDPRDRARRRRRGSSTAPPTT